MNWNSVVDTRWLSPCDAYTRQRGYTLPSTPNRHTMCHFVGIFCSSVSIYVYTFVPIHFWCVAFAPAFSLFNLWMCNHVFRLQSIRIKLKTWNNMESHGIMLLSLSMKCNFDMMKLYQSNIDVIHCQNEIGALLHPRTTWFTFSIFYFPIFPLAFQ